MIKALSENGDIILGLSTKNIELLQQGKPILVDEPRMGLKGRIAIIWGETEEAIVEQIKEYCPNVSGEDH